jgi:hypothetical protein
MKKTETEIEYQLARNFKRCYINQSTKNLVHSKDAPLVLDAVKANNDALYGGESAVSLDSNVNIKSSD